MATVAVSPQELARLDVSRAELWAKNEWRPYFAHLRAEEPVSYCPQSAFGPYWSVTRYDDIVAVEEDAATFSSSWEHGGIVIFDMVDTGVQLRMFIAMDDPEHGEKRKAIAPAVTPSEIAKIAGVLRQRTSDLLDTLPVGETFDWVHTVSIPLTTAMAATLFNFPWEERRLLTYWSDIATAAPESQLFKTDDPDTERKMVLFQCVDYFTRLWNERVNAEPKGDLISMLAHGEATRNMDRMEYLGNLILLIVGGNDTTRNTMTGSVLAMFKNPDQLAKLKADPSLIPSMVSETIRWQTPLAYMRRTATRDVELGGKTIKKGDKVLMWYVSGNRDEEVIENPNAYIIDRPRPRNHLSFGFGIHRCVGNRLAELQLRILWEEILVRFPEIRVVEEPHRVRSFFVKGYESMQVIIPSRL